MAPAIFSLGILSQGCGKSESASSYTPTAYSGLQGPISSSYGSNIPPQAIGSHMDGKLMNAEMLPTSGIGFKIHRFTEQINSMTLDQMNVWGTTQLVTMVQKISRDLQYTFPGSIPLDVADLSKKKGGKFIHQGHLSHQNGLDVDIGFPLNTQPSDDDPFPFFIESGKINRIIDVPRFWAALKMLGNRDDVVLIFVDPRIKRAMCRFAKSIKEFPERPTEASYHALNKLQPWDGHNNHFHLRMQCPSTSPQCQMAKPLPYETGAGC